MTKKAAKTKSRPLAARRTPPTPAPTPPVTSAPPLDSAPTAQALRSRSPLLEGVRRYAEKHFAKGRPWWAGVVEASDDDLSALIGRARTLAGAIGAVWRKQVLPAKTHLVHSQEPTNR